MTLELQAYDGDAGGIPRGDPDQVTLEPGGWAQKSGFLGNKGVANGWVRVRRLSGTAPWITYAVVNDGAGAGARTGDGAYVPMVATPPPSPWEISILKDGDPTMGLHRPSVTYDPSGSPTISYGGLILSSLTSKVKVARWDRASASWQVATLHEGGDTWHVPVLATDPKDGQPSVVYGVDVLQFAHWTGSSWKVEAVETVGKINDVPSLAYGPDGNPAIAYFAKTPTMGLRFARWNGSAWVTQSVELDPFADKYLTSTSLAFDSQGNPAIAYGARAGTGNRSDTLKLARWTGSEWRTEIVEEGVFFYGYQCSLAFDAQGRAWVGGRETVWIDQCADWPHCWLDGGLGMYDGHNWTVHELTPGETGLTSRDKEVQAVEVDQRGRVWAGTGNPSEGLDGKVQILEGLRAGDEVVVYSERDLDAGSRITVVPSLVGDET